MSTIQLSWAAVLPPGSTYTVWRNGAIVATQLGVTSYLDTTVADNTTYTYTVAAVNAYGPGLTSSPASATTPPAQVTGLIATAVSSSQINLSWTAAAGATSYTVRRGGVVVGTPSGTSFSDTGLAANTLYSYTVAANGTGGQGVQSAGASATTLSSGITWKPGHRVFGGCSGNRTTTDISTATAFMDKVDAWDINKNVKGYVFPFYMAALEGATAGDYTAGFNFVSQLIAKAKSYNPPRDISFTINLTGNGSNGSTSTAFPSWFVPAYLNSSFYGGGCEWQGKIPTYPATIVGTFWNINFMTRVKELVKAYYSRFGPDTSTGGIYLIDLFSEVSIGVQSAGSNGEFLASAQTVFPLLRAAAPKLMMSIRLTYGLNGSATYLVSIANLMQQYQIAMGDEDLSNNITVSGIALSTSNQNARMSWGDQIYKGLFTNAPGATVDHSALGDWAHVGNCEIAEYGQNRSPLAAVPPADVGSGYIYDNPQYPGIMTGANNLKSSHMIWHLDQGQFGPNINNTTYYANAPNNPTPGPGAGTNAPRPHLGDVITGNQAYAAQGVQGPLAVASTAYPSTWP